MKQYYLVTLDGMPEGEERSRLEQAFRDAINAQYTDERAAGGALHAHLDTLDEGRAIGGLPWADAYAIACEDVPAPAGTRFRCDINWPTLAGG